MAFEPGSSVMPGSAKARVIGLTLLAATLLACTEARAPLSPAAQESPDRSAAFLNAVLDHFARGAEGRLLFDPRPLRPGAEPWGTSPGSVDPGDGATVRFRGRAARERGIALTDAVRDHDCAFVRGAQVPERILNAMPDSARRKREECLARGLFTTVVLGNPLPLQGEEAQAYPSAWKVRAFRQTTSSFEAWDVYLGARSGGWQVLGTKRIFGIQS